MQNKYTIDNSLVKLFTDTLHGFKVTYQMEPANGFVVFTLNTKSTTWLKQVYRAWDSIKENNENSKLSLMKIAARTIYFSKAA